MTYSEEYKIMREYLTNRGRILNALPEGSSKAAEGLEALKIEYVKLLRNQRIRMKKDPSVRLRVMQKRLEDMFQLLALW